MRIAAIAAHTVRWPIAGTGAARGRSERAAVLVEVRSAAGAIGLGEAAPLPGMSSDAIEQAEAAIARLAALAPFDVERAPAGAVAQGAICELRDPRAALSWTTAPPAARFAIETALCDAAARERGVSLAALLAGSAAPPASRGAAAPPPRVPLAAVIDDPDAARRAYADGIRCFKIKLAADDPVERVFAIAAAAPGARLRIDANRSWPRAEVAGRRAALAALPIDYVEEPCRDAHELLAPLPRDSLASASVPGGSSAPFAARAPGPLAATAQGSGARSGWLALDESLAELGPAERDAALRSPALAAVVLKPTLLGGLSAALALAAAARRCGVAAVASHALEGPIGTAACAELALALADLQAAEGASGAAPGHAAAGLAPHAALAGWSIDVPQLAADHIHPADAPGLGFADLDLARAVRACRGAMADPGRRG